MLTLKNVFWVVLVLLNLTFILAVSYSRLKPAPEVTPYNRDNEVVSGKISPNSASWRFATVNTTDIPALEVSDNAVSKATDTRDPAATEAVKTEPINKNLTNEPEMADSEAAMAISGIPEITTSETENPQIADKGVSSEADEGAKMGKLADNTKIAASSLDPDTFEIAAASMANSSTAETNTPETSKDHFDTEKPNLKNRQASTANYNVDTYYDGNLVRTEETDNKGNLRVTVKETMEGLGKLPSSDAHYVEALERLKNSQYAPKTKVSETVATHQVKESKSEKSIDYFNKVDVSDKDTRHPRNDMILAKQIEAAVSADDFAIQNDSTPNKSEDNYFQALGTESTERTNQMRTIKVARGDTLWSIAVRAYGSGFEYGKIFDANPYLSDPDKIKVGDTLRVPL